jgi:hypothetical protein
MKRRANRTSIAIPAARERRRLPLGRRVAIGAVIAEDAADDPGVEEAVADAVVDAAVTVVDAAGTAAVAEEGTSHRFTRIGAALLARPFSLLRASMELTGRVSTYAGGIGSPGRDELLDGAQILHGSYVQLQTPQALPRTSFSVWHRKNLCNAPEGHP